MNWLQLLLKLPVPVLLPDQGLQSVEEVDAAYDKLIDSYKCELWEAAAKCGRTCLLWYRTQDDCAPRLRAYLQISITKFRVAYTQLALSAHGLAVERG